MGKSSTAEAVEAGSDEARLAAKERTLDRLISEHDAALSRVNELADRIQAMTAPSATPAERPPLLLENESVDRQRVLERIADIWPRNTDRLPPQFVVVRTFRVKPKGSAYANYPEAIVSNCLDEGDAASCYFRHVNGGTGFTVATSIVAEERYPPEETAPADPAGARA